MPDASTYHQAAEMRRQFLVTQRRLLAAEDAAYERDADALEQQVETTWRELTGYLLPDVSDETLSSLEQRLGSAALLAAKQRTTEAIFRSERRRAVLAEMDEIVHHDIVLARAEDEIAEIQEAHDAFQRQLDHWRSSPWFEKLGPRWFLLGTTYGLVDRLRRWRQVSLYMADLERDIPGRPGLRRFRDPKDLRARYERLVADATPVAELYERRVKRRDKIVDLMAEYIHLEAGPEELLAALYTELGELIRRHLARSPASVRYALAQQDRTLTILLRKVHGQEAQVQYLRQLRTNRIVKVMAQLDADVEKLSQKMRRRAQKSARGKAIYVSHEELTKLRNLKGEKWAKRLTRLTKLRTRIVDFQRWAEGSFGVHYLWWDAITKNKPGEDIYEVSLHHRLRAQEPERFAEDTVLEGRLRAALREPPALATDLAVAGLDVDGDGVPDIFGAGAEAMAEQLLASGAWDAADAGAAGGGGAGAVWDDAGWSEDIS